MTCAGSLFFKDLPDEESSDAAREGTAAGELLERILTGQDIGTHARNDYPFDEDMMFYTKPIAQQIIDNAQSEINCEKRIDWQTRSGIWIRGQFDISYIANGNLHIEDLKYGWGPVEVFENWQLLGYAIGEVMRRQMFFDKIVMRIHQPRPHHEDGPTRTWTLTYNELLGYKERIEKRTDEIAAGDKTLVTSPKCKYCPAAVACPAMSKAFYRGVEIVHEFVQDNIDDKELSFQLDLVTRVSELIKIKSDSLKALAVDRLKKGAIIPNYVTEPSYGDRKWQKKVNPEMMQILSGFDLIEKNMMSPAKAEKLGVPKDLVNALVDRHFLGLKIVKRNPNSLGEKIFGEFKK